MNKTEKCVLFIDTTVTVVCERLMNGVFCTALVTINEFGFIHIYFYFYSTTNIIYYHISYNQYPIIQENRLLSLQVSFQVKDI